MANDAISLEKLSGLCSLDDVYVGGMGMRRARSFDERRQVTRTFSAPIVPAISQKRSSGGLNQTFVGYMGENKPLHSNKALRRTRAMRDSSTTKGPCENLNSQA